MLFVNIKFLEEDKSFFVTNFCLKTLLVTKMQYTRSVTLSLLFRDVDFT